MLIIAGRSPRSGLKGGSLSSTHFRSAPKGSNGRSAPMLDKLTGLRTPGEARSDVILKLVETELP